MSQVFIPERFKKEVLIHIFKNLWSDQVPSAPLILGIHGPSGWGKTFQCEHILKDIGAKVFLISGGQLESKDAGEPARLIRYTYRNAGKSIKDEETKLAVLLINDVDTGLGNWGENVQTTVNTQVVFGELMHLTDYPTVVENTPTPRIPIILTGNDFTKLYSPLIRAGRMESFEWILNDEEKTAIVETLFVELSRQECHTLVTELQAYAVTQGHTHELNIAFFAHLRASLHDERVWEIIKHSKLTTVLTKVPTLQINATLPIVIQKGKQLIGSSKFVNHLVGD